MRGTCLNPMMALWLMLAGGWADTYLVSHGGGAKEVEIDSAWLVCRPPGGRAHLVSVGECGDAAAIAREAARLEVETGMGFDLLVREKGLPAAASPAWWLNRKICAQLVAGTDPQALARAVGAAGIEVPRWAPQLLILTFSEPGDSLRYLGAVRNHLGVLAADPLLAWRKQLRAIPNDPRFSYSASNTRYQWNLYNTGQNGSLPGLDANVTPVWDNWRGRGVTISFVDNGLEVTHPDLAANVNTAIDHDWNDATPDDPTPDNSTYDHGTRSAGVAAARGDNTIGVSGAAPEATIVGLRLLASNTTDQEDAEALAWRTDIIDISNNSWGPSDRGNEFFATGPLTNAAFADGVANGRGGRGTIYVWAGGNGRREGDYANYDGYNNRIETITVGAASFDGKQAWYSESGANLLVCAPSDGEVGEPAITTTTLTSRGTYTDEFGGTSAATPVVSGVLALVLESKPDLGWRDVQEILVRSSRMLDPGDADWVENAAGFHFNHKYGAGMVDAAAAAALAGNWANLGPQRVQNITSAALGLAVPDNSATGVSHTLSATGNPIRLEQVRLTVDIDHNFRGDLEISLTSPAGTVSQLTERHNDRGDHIRNFTFLTVRCWGESSAGDWTVRVADTRPGFAGVVNSLSLELYGTAPAGAGYEQWASANLAAGLDASELADPDCDGRPNLCEYALDSNPAKPDSRGAPALSGSAFEFAADSAKSDIRYRAEMSTDLTRWTPLATTVVASAGTIETRQATIPPMAGEKVYVRLMVERIDDDGKPQG